MDWCWPSLLALIFCPPVQEPTTMEQVEVAEPSQEADNPLEQMGTVIKYNQIYRRNSVWMRVCGYVSLSNDLTGSPVGTRVVRQKQTSTSGPSGRQSTTSSNRRYGPFTPCHHCYYIFIKLPTAGKDSWIQKAQRKGCAGQSFLFDQV